MHPQDKSGGEVRPPWHHQRNFEIDRDQEMAWILSELIEEFPSPLTFEEARVARVRDAEDWSESDAFEIAVKGLLAGGLLRRQGDLLIPVRPARLMADLGFELG